ncbi:MAG: hemolysin family protein [Chloroflexi bacterium]|nr:hemolysin family protein [Chloroflexota bacterium]MDA1239551.1 hemolysin family protein [Chloroflexota bacterium]MQC25495.1 HlyC/CorC family transporter [Chloroflexota bacterium]MQC48168.1 HlyC/CorC family transporter [Chloroflexota bacterium]
MDTNSLLPLIVLIAATLLLAVLSAAEANVIVLARRRLRGTEAPGLTSLLRTYVRERQRLLRALRTGMALAIITAVGAFAVLLDVATGPRVVISAAGALIIVSIVRSGARIMALARPQATADRIDGPVRLLQVVLLPIAWLLSAPIRIPMRAMGLGATSEAMDPAEELVGTLEAADEDAVLTEERRMIRGVLEMSDQTVRELMTPRTDITAVSTEATFGDVMKLVSRSGYSRIPLYEGSLDRVVGVVYAKDLLAYVSNGNVTPPLTAIARPPYVVPETKRANELLADMRRDRVHLALAVDEYGGTAGIVTVEDLVEEIVGAITDEYDTMDIEVQRTSDDEAIVDAGVTIDELNEIFGTEIESDDFDTVGGLIITELGRLAVPGDEVEVPPIDGLEEGQVALRLRVLSILGRRIKKVNVLRVVVLGDDESEAITAPAAESA